MIASPMKNQFIGSPPYREINGGEPMPPFLSRIPKARQKDTAKQWRTLRTNMKTAFCRIAATAEKLPIHGGNERIYMETTPHHLDIQLKGGIVCSADIRLTAAELRTIQIDRTEAARFAAQTAIAALAACGRSNPTWTPAQREAFAVDSTTATLACIHAM